MKTSDIRGQLRCSRVHREDLDGAPKAFDEAIVGNQAELNHGFDIALIVGVEALELADNNINHLQHLNAQSAQVAVEEIASNEPRTVGEKWDPIAHHVDVQAMLCG